MSAKLQKLSLLKAWSGIEHEGTRTFFYMVDQYFGNDSLKPFESKFIGSTGLAMVYLWLSWPSLMRGYQGVFQCVGIFIKTIVWNFCELFADGNFCEVLLVEGGFILFSLHMTMVCKHQSALIGGDGDSSSTAGPKAQGPRPPSR